MGKAEKDTTYLLKMGSAREEEAAARVRTLDIYSFSFSRESLALFSGLNTDDIFSKQG